MEQIVVKTEVQSNGEILLYYVDENGDNQEGVLTTIENIENDTLQIEDNSYVLGGYGDLDDNTPLQAEVELPDPWSEEETKRLLIFFNDNKTSFISGTTQKKHLWAVACKTMLIGKDQQACQEKLAELKNKYCEIRGYIKKGVYVKWPFLDLCHQAFHDDFTVVSTLNENNEEVQSGTQPKIIVLKEQPKEQDGILSIKHVNTRTPDEKVVLMLKMCLKYKEHFQKEHWRRDLWEKIAEEMGEDDGEYLQKRFLNHKQHYVTMLMKKKELGSSSVNWPYMDLFDKIFEDDANFHKKYFNTVPENQDDYSVPENEWNITQKTVLAKYYFDCYEEFEDATIPNKFLWTEVGRLIDKKPETCEHKYGSLRKEHLEKYIAGDYNLSNRIPIDIIFDHIIVQDIKTILSKLETKEATGDLWKTEQIDELVQFFYDNVEVFKDRDCHFVCWAAIAQKLNKTPESCKEQWDELVILYYSILEDKKEDSDMQINWRYIELFDRIFDYGIDSDLLKGYDTRRPQSSTLAGNVTVKKVSIKPEKESRESEEEKPSRRHDPDYTQNTSEPRTDLRSAKVLEHYLKNKDKFQHARNKLILWDPLAKQINMNSTQCSHRFRTLKQTYIEHIKQEIDKPRIPITWPYYALCKKVFGYRVIKNKLKQGQLDTDSDDWLAREIKLLISFFSKNFDEFSNNVEDVSKINWGPLATDLGKSETNCKEKFVELRKCYRKLKTMKTRNPDVKISWSYFNMFDRIYNTRDTEPMEVEAMEEEHLVMEGLDGEGGDEDYQCIIVLQDGQELPENTEVIDNSELIQQITNIPQLEETISYTVSEQKTAKWTKRAKKRLLVFYINHVRSHRSKEINPKEMWTAIAEKLPNKTSASCRKMFIKMKNSYKQADEVVKKNSPFTNLLEKVLKLKPKFLKSDQSKRQEKTYKDVPMAPDKVNMALNYYLEHIEEFVNPRFEKKYLWTQLANHISEPVTKVYNKVNYLKQAYNIETEEIAGEKTEFSALLKEIIAKEVAVEIVVEVNPTPDFNDDENTWTDDETEELMRWYLSNLDKFKNPKFNRSYLWMEASAILSKSPLVCSKKMSEIRTQYRNMVKQNSEGLKEWRFFELCQKIYGTGKKTEPGN